MSRERIGIQLYSVRGEVAKDLAATFAGIKKAGFEGAEPWSYDGTSMNVQGRDAKDVKKMLDDNGLECCGMHVRTSALEADNLKRSIEVSRILGNTRLILASDKTRISSTAGIMELAGMLNNASQVLSAEGMVTGYHAHGFDFITVDGEIAWDRLFKNTKPKVLMQMDIGNCMQGGGDPLGTLQKFPNRTDTIHIKDFGGADNSICGEGKVDWPKALKICRETQPVRWFVLEQGEVQGNGFDVPRRSLEALRKIGL